MILGKNKQNKTNPNYWVSNLPQNYINSNNANWSKDRHADQWDRKERTEINSHTW